VTSPGLAAGGDKIDCHLITYGIRTRISNAHSKYLGLKDEGVLN
jgi:hypothetical protein